MCSLCSSVCLELRSCNPTRQVAPRVCRVCSGGARPGKLSFVGQLTTHVNNCSPPARVPPWFISKPVHYVHCKEPYSVLDHALLCISQVCALELRSCCPTRLPAMPAKLGMHRGAWAGRSRPSHLLHNSMNELQPSCIACLSGSYANASATTCTVCAVSACF